MSARPWFRADRASLAVRLRSRGADITTVSDARELCGLPRLSASSASERDPVSVLVWLESPEGAAAYERAAAGRANALDCLAHHDRDAVSRVRRALGLRGSPSGWPLSTIERVIVAVRVAELAGSAL